MGGGGEWGWKYRQGDEDRELNSKPKYLKVEVCLPERMFGGDVNDKGMDIQHVEPFSSFYTVSDGLLHLKYPVQVPVELIPTYFQAGY